MKKSMLVLIVGGSLVSACSSYTCPTYTKAPEKEVKKLEKERI